ncbi:MAG TPA: hypothetical protein VM580_08185 [Labilithrix sp.]|nr:hypothetical protein [Labilithrix sp.]
MSRFLAKPGVSERVAEELPDVHDRRGQARTPLATRGGLVEPGFFELL